MIEVRIRIDGDQSTAEVGGNMNGNDAAAALLQLELVKAIIIKIVQDGALQVSINRKEKP